MRPILFALTALMLTAPTALAQDTGTPAAPTAPAQAAPAAPMLPAQASIAVGEFDCKASRCYRGLGANVADALTTALLDTGKFSVMERENLGSLNEEAFAGGGATFQGADLLIFGAITQFEPEAQSGGFSLGGLFSVGQKQATIGADLRIVDVKTRRTIAGTHVEGVSTSQGVSMKVFGNVGNNSNGSVEKAVAAMLKQAVDQLITRIPAGYYR